MGNLTRLGYNVTWIVHAWRRLLVHAWVWWNASYCLDWLDLFGGWIVLILPWLVRLVIFGLISKLLV